jgi:hypothetical protein
MKKLVCESLDELYGIEIQEPPIEIEYSGGEKAAITRGNDVLTKSQLAAMYLAAKDAEGRSEDTRGRGDSGLTRNALKMNKEENTDFQKLPAPRLGDVLDLKPRTVSYTLSKFRLLLQGLREGIPGNDLYNKIIDAFDEFEKIVKDGRLGDIYTLASEAVNMNATTERSEKWYEEQTDQGRKTRERIQKRNKDIVRDTYDLYNKLRVAFGERTPKMVINKLSAEYEVSAEDIRTIIKMGLKDDPNLARKF